MPFSSPLRRAAVRLLLALAAAGGAALDGTAEPRPAPGSVAFDYRNHPEVERLIGFETVLLSPRAAPAARALRARGARVLVWLQPFVCPWRGEPPAPGTLLGDAHRLATAHGARLRNRDGSLATIHDFDLPDCSVFDFRDSAFVRALARLVADRVSEADGLLLDYGCASLGWERSLARVAEEVWPAWSRGHLLYMAELRRLRPGWSLLCQCQSWSPDLAAVCDGLVHEKVGWSLAPFDHVLRQALAAPGKRSILSIVEPLKSPDPRRRRISAALALLFDYGFSLRIDDGVGLWPARDREHFELVLGRLGERREPRPGVHLREGEFGFVLVNLSAEPYTHGGAVVPQQDALVIQTRDPATGAELPPRAGDGSQ